MDGRCVHVLFVERMLVLKENFEVHRKFVKFLSRSSEDAARTYFACMCYRRTYMYVR
jgi:hypothetical protein